MVPFFSGKKRCKENNFTLFLLKLYTLELQKLLLLLFFALHMCNEMIMKFCQLTSPFPNTVVFLYVCCEYKICKWTLSLVNHKPIKTQNKAGERSTTNNIWVQVTYTGWGFICLTLSYLAGWEKAKPDNSMT